jgi:hypothetical protein
VLTWLGYSEIEVLKDRWVQQTNHLFKNKDKKLDPFFVFALKYISAETTKEKKGLEFSNGHFFQRVRMRNLHLNLAQN